MPQVGDFWESYRTDEFVVTIDGVESPSITKVSGLSDGEYDTIEQPDGGNTRIHKISSTKVKFDPVTIERNVDGSPGDERFQAWFKEAFDPAGQTQGGSSVRKNGIIEKRHNGETVLSFAFYGAWIKSSKFNDLEAGSNNLFKQTIVLEIEYMERLPT